MADEYQLSETVRESVEKTGNAYLTEPFEFDHDDLFLKVRLR